MLSAHEETDHEGRFTVDKQDRVRKAQGTVSFSFIFQDSIPVYSGKFLNSI